MRRDCFTFHFTDVLDKLAARMYAAGQTRWSVRVLQSAVQRFADSLKVTALYISVQQPNIT